MNSISNPTCVDIGSVNVYVFVCMYGSPLSVLTDTNTCASYRTAPLILGHYHSSCPDRDDSSVLHFFQQLVQLYPFRRTNVEVSDKLSRNIGNYLPKLHNILEERSSHLHHSKCLISDISLIQSQPFSGLYKLRSFLMHSIGNNLLKCYVYLELSLKCHACHIGSISIGKHLVSTLKQTTKSF
jgi:hypothetical protein